MNTAEKLSREGPRRVSRGRQRAGHRAAVLSLAVYARLAREILERAGPLITIVFVEGSGRDPDLRAFIDKIEGERAIGTAGMANHVATRFGLRSGLTESEAADVLWSLTSPELADRFIRRRGWSPDRYEAWLAQTTADALVGRLIRRSVRSGTGRRSRGTARTCCRTSSTRRSSDPARCR